MRKYEALEEVMKIRCYIMCYYPPEIALLDKIRDEIRADLLRDFLAAKVISKDVYEKLVRK